MSLMCDAHKIFLSPNGAIKKNDTLNSSLEFDIINPITSNPNIVYATIRVTHAEIPNSLYIVNSNNNVLQLSTGTYNIPYGNYNANTLMTLLNSLFPSNMVMSFSTSNGKFSLTYNSSFQILSTSTCYKLLGFSQNTTYSSTSNIITMPYMCNLLGTKNIYVRMPNFTFDNMNPAIKDKCTLCNIAVNVPSYSLILYNNTSNVGTIIKNQFYPDKIILELLDDDFNFCDFNNIDFNITVEIDYFIDNS